MTLPTLQLLLDDGTGTFPFDISTYVLGNTNSYSFSRGRADWQGGVTAGILSLTLNNADGRFSPGSTKIASPSPIKVDARIRLKETINGITFTRFTGYVKSWPVAWPAVVSSWSTVTITATDAQARAERRILRSVPEEEIMSDSPSAYYTLGEPAGVLSAADSSGNQHAALTVVGTGNAVVFGTSTGPSTDGLTAAQFANGQYLSNSDPALQGSVGSFPNEWICVFNTSTTGARMGLIGDPLGTMILGIDATGHLIVDANTPPVSPNVVTDGATHVAEMTHSGTTVSLYLDGALVATGTDSIINSSMVIGKGFTGAISHVAHFVPNTSTTRITAHANAMLNGFSGESGTARITRIAGYAGIPVGTFDASLTNVPFVDITGSSAWAAMQTVSDAEGGLLFIDGSGNLTFQNRNRPVAKTAPDLTLAGMFVVPDAQPTTDDQYLVNYFTATAQSTQVAQVVRNTTSETSHGRYDGSADYLVATDAEALDRANWIVANFAEPTTRFGTLTVNLFGMTASQAATVLTNLELGAWFRATMLPTQNQDGTTSNVMIEGYTVNVTGGSWQIVCNVVSRSLFSPVWILDDPTYSVLDSTTRVFV
jgi:hypothetical protein